MKFLFSEEPWRREFKNSSKTGSSVKKKSSKSRMSTSKELCIDFNWIENHICNKVICSYMNIISISVTKSLNA